MEQETKIKIIKGVSWELHPPFCEICGAHRGEMYNKKRGWKNPYNYESYGDSTCPICFQKYEYEEGDRMVLSEDDLNLLRHARARGGDNKI